jgi:translocation and assembly module TamB
MKGKGTVPPTADAPLELTLVADRFLVYNTEDSRVLVSPNLTVAMRGTRVDLKGDVEVPEAKIEYKRKFATVEVSRDAVFVGKSAEAAKASEAKAGKLEVHSRVRLILGEERVSFKGSGFNTRLTGSLLAIDEPGRPTVGTGELETQEGTYKAYGQDLTIEHGRLVFAGGPIDNPGLDARAYRKAKDGVIAGINIKGTLKTPEVTLYSDPPMAQADALAYLLLGHPLNQTTTSQEGSLVANAAGALGIKGGNMLAKKLASRFGLEEAKIETEGTYKEAALVLGKYLSPKLFVEYGIGLFTRVSTIRINYLVSKKWTVRAETGVANGADILYKIEK